MKYRSIVVLLTVFTQIVAWSAPRVVTTIKPLYSLVAQVTYGISEPTLLVTQGSPHGYQLKPSAVVALSQADLVVWVSDNLEIFMNDARKKIQAETLEWEKLPSVSLLENRRDGLWEDGDDHHDEDHDHEGRYNIHLWLNTENAIKLVVALADKLSTMDEENRVRYQENAEKTIQSLRALKQNINENLASVKDKQFMVFHDAYPYFEQEFGLKVLGVVRVDAEHEPNIQRIEKLRKMLVENRVSCIFSETQFPSTLVEKLRKGTSTHVAVLDPLGDELSTDGELYQSLLLKISEQIRNCALSS